MPDHLHCVWTLPPGDADFATRWGLIKRRVSMALGDALHVPAWMNASRTKHRESTLWQRPYFEHTIRDEADFARCVDYLHHNPVKHGLVGRVADWKRSSFHRHVANGSYAREWTCAGSSDLIGEAWGLHGVLTRTWLNGRGASLAR